MKLMILAGEVSGDIHAGKLVKELKEDLSNAEFIGIGGPMMETAGVRLFYHLKDLAVLGIAEVIKKYGHFRRIFKDLTRILETERPDALILVDYPGFNVRFAKVAKKKGIPVIYYISPQIWAWARWRRFVIARRVDKMLVIFPFEKDFYKGTGLDVEYVGHPLADRLNLKFEKEPKAERTGSEPVVALLPGSRHHEVESLFPLMVGAARLIKEQIPGARFVASAANKVLHREMAAQPGVEALPVAVSDEKASELIQKADLALVASGTATLECGVLLTPMVIVYKVSLLTWAVGRLVIRLPYIGLVNVVRGKKIMPELIQFDATSERLAEEAAGILKNDEKYLKSVEELRQVRRAVGEAGASRRAAKAITKYLNQLKASKA